MVDMVTVNPEIQQDDPDHVRAMLDKVDGQSDVVSDNNDIQQLLAGKYKDEEALQKGVLELLKKQNEGKTLEEIYKSLESGLGSQKAQQTSDKAEEDEPKTDNSVEVDFDLSPYETELLEKGELSAESYAQLEAKGFPRQVVDVYIEGQKAVAEKLQSEFYALVGGKDNYMSMIEWAGANLSETEIATFNNAINTDIATAKMVAEALYARYVKAKGNPPKNLIQGGVTSNVTDVYESREQLISDMNDSRYSKDPAFRKAVQEKLARSNIL